MVTQGKCASGNMKQSMGCMRMSEHLTQIETSRFRVTKNKRFRASITQYCKHFVTISLCVRQPLKDKGNCGVSRRLLPPKLFEGLAMNDFMRKIYRPNNSSVNLTSAKRTRGQFQGNDSRSFFRSYGAAWTSYIKLAIDSIGYDVRHRTQHPCSLKLALECRPGILQPFRIDQASLIAQPFPGPSAQLPARTIAGQFGITSHADHDGGAVTREHHTVSGFAGRFQHQRLLRQRLPQIMRRKFQTIQCYGH